MVSYERDVRAECSLCGHEYTQRRWLETPLHSISCSLLNRLALADPGLEAECEQCGEDLTDEEVTAAILRWAFPSGEGVCEHLRLRERSYWQLLPLEKYDPQALPAWSGRDDLSAVECERIDEATVLRCFGRPLNPKAVVLHSVRAHPAEPAAFSIGGGLSLHLTPAGSEFDVRDGESARRIAAAGELTAKQPGSQLGWLRRDLAPLSDFDIWVVVSHVDVEDALQIVAAELPFEAAFEAEGTTRVLRIVGAAASDEPRFDLDGIAGEAASTVLCAADAARLEFDRAFQLLSHGTHEDEGYGGDVEVGE